MTYFLGIDIGALRTSAALARAGADGVEPVDLGDDGCGVASVLHLGADGGLDVGVAAERWADDEPDRVVRGFPGLIGDDVAMLLAGEPWAPEELTAWLVRWVVDRVAEREGPADAVAVTRPASWDAERTALLAGALAEQDLDATFLTAAWAAEWCPDGGGEVASAAACGAAAALRAGGAGSEGAGDVAAQLAALAHFPGVPASRKPDDDGPPADAGLSADVPAPRSHRSGGWAAGPGAGERRPGGSGTHASARSENSGAHAATRTEGTGAHAALTAGTDDTATDGTGRAEPDGADDAGPPAAADNPEDALLAALGGFTGTLGATNTAGLLSGYTPPSGLATSGRATALVAEPVEELLLPTQRSGSGRWAAVPEVDGHEPEANTAPSGRRERTPAALVSIGGAAAALAVVATLFVWPAPRTANSAVSRPVPLVPALTSPVEQTAEPTLAPTVAPTTTHRPRPVRVRRTAVPPPVVQTTTPPSASPEPTEPATTSAPPPSESTAPPTTTNKRDDD